MVNEWACKASGGRLRSRDVESEDEKWKKKKKGQRGQDARPLLGPKPRSLGGVNASLVDSRMRSRLTPASVPALLSGWRWGLYPLLGTMGM